MLSTFIKAQLGSLGPTELSDQLERGRIVYFPECPIALPTPDQLSFLRQLAQYAVGKNLSYYPDADRLVGVGNHAGIAEKTQQILSGYAKNLHSFLSRYMPTFFRGCRTGISSFRPFQERGRNLSPHASNELVHVDAGAYGATHGARILRFFTNVHPTEDRVWISKGTFAQLYQRHGQKAGIRSHHKRVEEGPLDRLYSRMLKTASGPLPMLSVLDSSPYDRLMRKFHNYMKDTPGFQMDPVGHHQFAFPPYSSWMVLTDGVSHACVSGQFALADTFLIPLENCHLRDLAPFEILKSETRVTSA